MSRLNKHWIFIPTNDGSSLFEGKPNGGVMGTLKGAFTAVGCKVINTNPPKGKANEVYTQFRTLLKALTAPQHSKLSGSECRSIARLLSGGSASQQNRGIARSVRITWNASIYSPAIDAHVPAFNSNKRAFERFLASLGVASHNYRRAVFLTKSTGSDLKGLSSDFQKTIVKVFSHPINMHGIIIRFIAGDNSRKLGISLFYTPYAHILAPPTTSDALQQSEKRAARQCSFMDQSKSMLHECTMNPDNVFCNTLHHFVKRLVYANNAELPLIQSGLTMEKVNNVIMRSLAEFATDCADHRALHAPLTTGTCLKDVKSSSTISRRAPTDTVLNSGSNLVAPVLNAMPLTAEEFISMLTARSLNGVNQNASILRRLKTSSIEELQELLYEVFDVIPKEYIKSHDHDLKTMCTFTSDTIRALVAVSTSKEINYMLQFLKWYITTLTAYTLRSNLGTLKLNLKQAFTAMVSTFTLYSPVVQHVLQKTPKQDEFFRAKEVNQNNFSSIVTGDSLLRALIILRFWSEKRRQKSKKNPFASNNNTTNNTNSNSSAMNNNNNNVRYVANNFSNVNMNAATILRTLRAG